PPTVPGVAGDAYPVTMPVRRLDLLLDEDLGPVLWVREETGPGRSRALEDLSALREEAPAPLAAALAHAPAQLRQRVRIRGRGGDRRVPGLPLTGPELTGLVGAVKTLLEQRFGEDIDERLSDLLAEGAAVRLGGQLVAMPGLLRAVVL